VVEIDRDLVTHLSTLNLSGLDIHPSDALKFNFGTLAPKGRKLRVIGNLPYNISSPLLFHLLEFHSQIKDMFFMLQKEVVERICATPNNKSYGRLSVMIQAHCEATMMFSVPNTAFDPAPKVESAILYLKPKATDPDLNYQTLELLAKTAFSKRRKTLNNNLKDIIDKQTLEQAPVDLRLRAENLSVNDFIILSKWYERICNR
jgi:16S rRNA (adenine1518-N6/adenine1519-N6)-dimethyltransferase